MQKHSIKIAGGHGSQLAGVMIGTGEWPSFFVNIIYCTCHVCYGTTLYLPLIRHIAPHTLLIFPFLPTLVWHAGDVPRRGECREALPYRTM